jgi:hypothetical protein
MLKLIENYIYFHHLGEGIILPQYPEDVTDTMSASFSQTNILGRSAPIFTYGGSGPRVVSFTMKLHRDMLNDVNITNKTFLGKTIDAEETINELINITEASVLPKYTDATKAVNPPIISVRIGKDIYIKGVCTQTSHTFYGPIRNEHYLQCDISLSIQEYDAYDAELAKTLGKYRGVSSKLGL